MSNFSIAIVQRFEIAVLKGKIYVVLFLFSPLPENLSAETKNEIYNTPLGYFNQMLSTLK